MKYQITFTPKAEKEFTKLQNEDHHRILTTLLNLRSNPFPVNIKGITPFALGHIALSTKF